MTALLDAEAMFGDGLQQVPHGASDLRYKRILNGQYDEALARPALLDSRLELGPDIGVDVQPELEGPARSEARSAAGDLGGESSEVDEDDILEALEVELGLQPRADSPPPFSEEPDPDEKEDEVVSVTTCARVFTILVECGQARPVRVLSWTVPAQRGSRGCTAV